MLTDVNYTLKWSLFRFRRGSTAAGREEFRAQPHLLRALKISATVEHEIIEARCCLRQPRSGMNTLHADLGDLNTICSLVRRRSQFLIDGGSDIRTASSSIEGAYLRPSHLVLGHLQAQVDLHMRYLLARCYAICEASHHIRIRGNTGTRQSPHEAPRRMTWT